jgi:NADP-dependent 3-hydroxy acid dehydrogenase YdfG
MKNIVITGSTKGIGYGLADAFLSQGCQVVVNGRTQTSVATAVTQLGSERAYGLAAVVSEWDQVQALWDFALKRMGSIDIWVNNAGLSHDTVKLWELSPEDGKTVVDVNILGLMYGSQVAMNGMLAQGHGQIFNMEGFGSNGRTRDGMSMYGSTKAAVAYLNKAFIKEAKGTAVQIGSLQPGMVMTALVLDRFKDQPEELDKVKGIFNIIGDSVENVTPWLAAKMLANEKHGVHFNYAPTMKLIGRFLTAPFSKRNLFAD